jgi:hypothetical protein
LFFNTKTFVSTDNPRPEYQEVSATPEAFSRYTSPVNNPIEFNETGSIKLPLNVELLAIPVLK